MHCVQALQIRIAKLIYVWAVPVMIHSAVIRGLDAILIEVEVGILQNQRSGLAIVGLGKREVQESGLRVQNAFQNSGFHWPGGLISVNLAPADIPKEGTTIELALALGILQASSQLTIDLDAPLYAIGEMSLDGSLKLARGALRIAQAIPDGSIVVAPAQNEHELALLRQMKDANKNYKPYVVSDLNSAVDVVQGLKRPLAKTTKENLRPAFSAGKDFAQIKGQKRAKRALEVAAAGGHNVLLIGPPGEGKSLMAKALPTILPRLTPQEIIELTGIYSASAKLPSSDSIILERPCRAVHHTTSRQALVGGGPKFPLPGEITLAHRGVLFLDEILEFGPSLLETLRQPLEDGSIHLQRTGGSAEYPCEVILAAAMNPCRCGMDGEFICSRCNRRLSFDHSECPDCSSQERRPLCTCTDHEKRRYKARLSGPIRDRIDLVVRVGALSPEDRESSRTAESSRVIRKRVEEARQIQHRRFEGKSPNLVNARIPGGYVDDFCDLHTSARTAMHEVNKRIHELSTRGYDKLLKVARTLADLNKSSQIYKKHIVEAAELCDHEDVRDFLLEEADVEPCPSCGEAIEPRHHFCPSCGHVLQ